MPIRINLSILFTLFFLLITTNLHAHPGGTDATGGHTNRKTGKYHHHSKNKSSTRITKAWTGKVVGVSDGDTIKVLNNGQQVKIRLYGIDTPEKKQSFGMVAKRFTLDMVAGKTVDIEPIDIDRYGRTVGLVRINGVSLNAELVRSGYAWVYDRYCKKAFCADWKGLETKARAAGIGLWAEPGAQAPWDWRREKRNK